MSVYLSYAPSILAVEVENTSALPDAPQVETPTVPARSRYLVAGILRRTARLELAIAARLERQWTLLGAKVNNEPGVLYGP